MYNFVIPDEDPGGLQVTQITDVDLAWKAFQDGKWCWTLQSYLILREYMSGLTVSREPIQGAINLVHGGHVTEFTPRADLFLVCLQADYRRCPWAQIHIVQNQKQVLRSSDYYVPHWPQPGLVARCPNRNGVRCVAFAGRGYYLAGGESRWTDETGGRGFEFKHMDPSNWNDFSGVDIVIGIRSFDGQTYDTKPPSKLINAWHAGTPFVGGHDSAFKQIGTPTEDYYVVTTQEEACDVIADLARNTSQYARIVQKGFDQAKQYSRHAIAQRWVDLLKGPIDIRYSQWTKRGVCASWHAAVNAKYAYARQELGRLWRHLKKSQAS